MPRSLRIVVCLLLVGAAATITVCLERAAVAQQAGPLKWGLVKVSVLKKDSVDVFNDGRTRREFAYTPTTYVSRDRHTENGKLTRDRHFQHTFSVPPAELVEGQTFNVTVTGKTLSGGKDLFIGDNASAGGGGLIFEDTITLDGKPFPKDLAHRNTYLGNHNNLAWEVKDSVASYRVTVPPKDKALRFVNVTFYSGSPLLGTALVRYDYELGAKPIDVAGGGTSTTPGTGTGPSTSTGTGAGSDIEGTWTTAGGEIRITKHGDTYTATYVKVPPSLSSVFKPGDIAFRNAKKTGPDTFQGDVCLRFSGGREEWRASTMKVDGDKLTIQFDQTNVTTALTVWTRVPSGNTGSGTPGGTPGTTTGTPGTTGTPTQTIPAEGMVLVAPLDLKVARGSRVLVPIQLVRAKDVRNMKFELKYLPEVVTGVSDVASGNLLTAISKANLNRPGLFTFDFAQDQSSPLNGNGTVANFRFDATGAPRTRTPLTLTVDRVDDSNRARLPISVSHGSIIIYDPKDKTDPNNPGWNGGGGSGGTGGPRLQPTCSGTGRQTMADAICCLEVSVGLKGPLQSYLQMDLNQDGKVDSGDAVIIMDNLARGSN